MSPWVQELWRILSWVVGLLLIGLMLGHVILFLFIACLSYLGWHIYNIYRLEQWFTKKNQIPDAPGIWGEIFYRLYRLQQRNRKRKRKFAEILHRFESSTAAIPDAAVVLGPDYEIEWFNKAACQLLGLQNPQDRGQPITNLLRSPLFYQYLLNGNEKDSVQFISPANSNLMLKVTVIAYADNQRLLIARDVTQLHRLEQIRSDFIANVSHELRTPLTVMTGFLETLIDVGEHPFQRPLLLMAQQTTRMRNIVEDLLLLSRLEAEPTIETIEPVQVVEMLTSICEEAKLLSGEQQHHITLDAQADLLIYGRYEELRSAFSNLIFNAVRYTPAQGKINICWYANAQGLHLEVNDTGEGIPPEHLPRLSERFYRVDVGRSRNRGGTGLGLAIVKHVLNRHKGQLHIESTLGKGSTFRCDFPLATPTLAVDELALTFPTTLSTI